MEQKKSKNNIKLPKKRKAFSLIEVLTSMFIFSVVMIVVTGTMVNAVVIKKRIQGSAQNLEEARFAMETMAKTLRGSKIFGCNGETTCPLGGAVSVETFDYSQGKCIQYEFIGNQIGFRNGAGDPSIGCTFSGSLIPMVNNSNKIENMSFNVVMSNDETVGRVTIFMEICSKYNGAECDASKSDRFPIQTTVSLRN